MTIFHVHRVGVEPRPTGRPTTPPPLILGPNLPDAACEGHDGHCGAELHGPLWDAHVDGETADQRTERHHAAIRICQHCPIRGECLNKRLEDNALGPGVWGGRLFDTKHCHCGHPLPEHSPPTRKHCSRACGRGTTPQVHPPRRCEQCNSHYISPQPQQRFCRPACRDRYRGKRAKTPGQQQGPRPPGLTHCQGCGDPITPAEQALGKRNCSKTCRNRASHQRQHKQVAA